MGIENFFNGLIKNNYVDSNVKYTVNCDMLYLDFNSIIYTIANKLENDVNYLLYCIIIQELDEKSIKIAKELGYTLKNIDENVECKCNDYNTFIKNNITDDKIIMMIDSYINYIIDDLVNGNSIKRLFISFDGIPTMTKIVEQKRRRYMSYIINGLKRKIYLKYKEDFEQNRVLYEKHKYGFDRGKIAPFNSYMTDLYEYFKSDNFTNKMKNKYTCLTDIIISSHLEPGEGEKKIMEDIITTNLIGNLIIYSPDSDVIILSVLIRNILNRKVIMNNSNNVKNCNVGLIKYSSFDDKHTYIDSTLLCNNIHSYIQSKTLIKLDEDRVTNDISFIFTLFGNDFIPKIQSIDTHNNIETLLDIYVNTIETTYKSRHFGMYIVYYSKNRYRINYSSFTKYIELLSKIEVSLLKDKYMALKYKNYKKLKNIFNCDMLYPEIMLYIQLSNIILSSVYNSVNNVDLKDTANKIYNSLLNSTQNINCIYHFVNKFIEVEKINIELLSCENDLYNQIINKLIKIVGYYVHNKYICTKLHLQLNEFNIKDNYHQDKIKRTFIHNKMNVSSYDENVYMLDRKSGNYNDLFNMDSNNIQTELNLNTTLSDDPLLSPQLSELSSLKNGILPDSTVQINNEIGVFKISSKKRYKYESSDIIDDSKKYYSNIFGIDIENDKEKMNDLLKEYMKGLLWVFDFYMNKNDKNFNTKMTSTWYYKYSHAPLLFHLSKLIQKMTKQNDYIANDITNNYINKDKLDNKDKPDNKDKWFDELYNQIAVNSYVQVNNFMTLHEHYTYINPKKRIDKTIIGDKLSKILDNKELFPDLDEMIEDIWNRKPGVLNFMSNNYLNKAHLIKIDTKGLDEWKDIIKNYSNSC